MRQLLIEFGPNRQSYHPEYPFWALQQDGLWILESKQEITLRKGSSNPSKGELIEKHAVGAFKASIIRKFKNKPELLTQTAKQLLASHFPGSLHQDIANAVGLVLDEREGSENKRSRDPKFRREVLIAYDNRCALCGLDLRIGSMTVGLEAAHIKWHQAGGEDTASNGIALCSLHHKLLDLGAYTLRDDLCILVSEHVNGGCGFDELLSHHGASLRKPQRSSQIPKPANLDWHRREVFKPRARELM